MITKVRNRWTPNGPAKCGFHGPKTSQNAQNWPWYLSYSNKLHTNVMTQSASNIFAEIFTCFRICAAQIFYLDVIPKDCFKEVAEKFWNFAAKFNWGLNQNSVSWDKEYMLRISLKFHPKILKSNWVIKFFWRGRWSKIAN